MFSEDPLLWGRFPEELLKPRALPKGGTPEILS